ncbi:hypothetical protein HYPSUDRAFT_149719 [Hypholoma sublateritium FD-334 SS-4]|uniref:Uncharacterized protein n=1 Tax=Hypholoma sublateritium (strain FD-334 SS-4) TaxID=945553 RepID=A0A0D2LVS3_HYPSF|nr:hypothetical protein HYPSUDRAFT_149719 [Hypholoma sublateritium FD-334 SS-4]
MQQKRLRAALLRGGYLWRVALSAMYFDVVLDGPSGLSSRKDEMFSVLLPDGKRYVDDELTEMETYTLLGTYVCRTGLGNQVALKSWCPSLSNFTKSGLDYGRWSNFNESLYNVSCSDTKSQNPILKQQPCPSNQWRNICRGSRDLARGLHHLEKVSLSLIRQYCN